jgi:hypothetical protein
MKVTYVCMFWVEAKIVGKQIKCQFFFFFLVFSSLFFFFFKVMFFSHYHYRSHQFNFFFFVILKTCFNSFDLELGIREDITT